MVRKLMTPSTSLPTQPPGIQTALISMRRLTPNCPLDLSYGDFLLSRRPPMPPHPSAHCPASDPRPDLPARPRGCRTGVEKTHWHLIWLFTWPQQPLAPAHAAAAVGLTARPAPRDPELAPERRGARRPGRPPGPGTDGGRPRQADDRPADRPLGGVAAPPARRRPVVVMRSGMSQEFGASQDGFATDGGAPPAPPGVLSSARDRMARSVVSVPIPAIDPKAENGRGFLAHDLRRRLSRPGLGTRNPL